MHIDLAALADAIGATEPFLEHLVAVLCLIAGLRGAAAVALRRRGRHAA